MCGQSSQSRAATIAAAFAAPHGAITAAADSPEESTKREPLFKVQVIDNSDDGDGRLGPIGNVLNVYAEIGDFYYIEQGIRSDDGWFKERFVRLPETAPEQDPGPVVQIIELTAAPDFQITGGAHRLAAVTSFAAMKARDYREELEDARVEGLDGSDFQRDVQATAATFDYVAAVLRAVRTNDMEALRATTEEYVNGAVESGVVLT